MVTYKEQFDKLTRAYIAEEVNPYRSCNCFIGNLLGTDEWKRNIESEHNGQYSGEEIANMEVNFMSTVKHLTIGGRDNFFANAFSEREINLLRDSIFTHPNYENALFKAFESTLDMLKLIHIFKGEIINNAPIFIKRQKEIAV